MGWLWRIWRRLRDKQEVKMSRMAVAAFDEMADSARAELDRQRAGIRRESQQRRQLRAQLERDILAATRDVLRRGRPS